MLAGGRRYTEPSSHWQRPSTWLPTPSPGQQPSTHAHRHTDTHARAHQAQHWCAYPACSRALLQHLQLTHVCAESSMPQVADSPQPRICQEQRAGVLRLGDCSHDPGKPQQCACFAAGLWAAGWHLRCRRACNALTSALSLRVLQAYARHGSNWLKVSEYLPMRSPQNIKNQVGLMQGKAGHHQPVCRHRIMLPFAVQLPGRLV